MEEWHRKELFELLMHVCTGLCTVVCTETVREEEEEMRDSGTGVLAEESVWT
jgi:hypothetical protein